MFYRDMTDVSVTPTSSNDIKSIQEHYMIDDMVRQNSPLPDSTPMLDTTSLEDKAINLLL